MFANKQDLPNAMGVSELTDKLGLHSLRSRTVRINTYQSSIHLYILYTHTHTYIHAHAVQLFKPGLTKQTNMLLSGGDDSFGLFLFSNCVFLFNWDPTEVKNYNITYTNYIHGGSRSSLWP